MTSPDSLGRPLLVLSPHAAVVTGVWCFGCSAGLLLLWKLCGAPCRVCWGLLVVVVVVGSPDSCSCDGCGMIVQCWQFSGIILMPSPCTRPVKACIRLAVLCGLSHYVCTCCLCIGFPHGLPTHNQACCRMVQDGGWCLPLCRVVTGSASASDVLQLMELLWVCTGVAPPAHVGLVCHPPAPAWLARHQLWVQRAQHREIGRWLCNSCMLVT